jgi:hypothetical protein
MRITKLALCTLTALCLSLGGGCDDAKKDAKDAKPEAKPDAKAADAKAGDVEAADAKGDAKLEDPKAVEGKAVEAKADAVVADPGAGGEAPAKIGVAECDEYVTKMSACIASGGIAPEQLEAQKLGLDMYAKSWADAMKANPAEGPALVPGCKAAIEMGKVSHPACFEAK